MTQRRRYSKEFKHEAVELARNSTTSVRQVALGLGLNPNMLARWKREADRDEPLPFKAAEPLGIRSWPPFGESWPV